MTTLLADLEAIGVRLWTEAGGIHYRPPNSIPANLRDAVVANKPALLVALAEWDGPAALRLMHLADGVVEACGSCGDEREIQAHAGRLLAAYLAGDMTGVRKNCALVEERARRLADANSGRQAA